MPKKRISRKTKSTRKTAAQKSSKKTKARHASKKSNLARKSRASSKKMKKTFAYLGHALPLSKPKRPSKKRRTAGGIAIGGGVHGSGGGAASPGNGHGGNGGIEG